MLILLSTSGWYYDLTMLANMTSFSCNTVNKNMSMPPANDYIEFSVDLIYSSNSNEEVQYQFC